MNKMEFLSATFFIIIKSLIRINAVYTVDCTVYTEHRERFICKRQYLLIGTYSIHWGRANKLSVFTRQIVF